MIYIYYNDIIMMLCIYWSDTMKISNFSLRFPAEIYRRLLDYKKTEKPYMSLNSLIVEIIDGFLEKQKEKSSSV